LGTQCLRPEGKVTQSSVLAHAAVSQKPEVQTVLSAIETGQVTVTQAPLAHSVGLVMSQG
jgi:hypothetical protein